MRDFIERMLRMPRVVLTVMVILLIAGVSAYMTLPKESFPAIDLPYYYVAISEFRGVAGGCRPPDHQADRRPAEGPRQP